MRVEKVAEGLQASDASGMFWQPEPSGNPLARLSLRFFSCMPLLFVLH